MQWECFPGQIIDYRNDIRIVSARRWPTAITPAQFEKVTQVSDFPAFLKKDVRDGTLHTYANGEISYCIKGVYAKVAVIWNFEAPKGAGDTHFSVMHGARSNLVIRQGEPEEYQPVLYIEPAGNIDVGTLEVALRDALPRVQQTYPGVGIKRCGDGWQVTTPPSYHVGHEAHFGQVTEQFLAYVKSGSLPSWEVPDMLAKYYTTTAALAQARNSR